MNHKIIEEYLKSKEYGYELDWIEKVLGRRKSEYENLVDSMIVGIPGRYITGENNET